MLTFFQKHREQNKVVRYTELGVLALLLVVLLSLLVGSLFYLNRNMGTFSYKDAVLMVRKDSSQEEGYDEDCTVCDVWYVSLDENYTCLVSYTYEEWKNLPETASIIGHIYESSTTGYLVVLKEQISDQATLNKTCKSYAKDRLAETAAPILNAALSLGILAISLCVMIFFASDFSLYEKIWFLSIMTLAAIVAIILPEESANGVNGIVIMLLYLLDTFLNILCELLISKQSRWNFIVSVAVELTEILICIVLMYRFATMVTTLFFWLPIDILSFINWTKHKDEDENEVTKVRRLTGWQEALVLFGIAIWTLVVGWFLSGLEISSDLFGGNEILETIVCYLDACASAVGVANGLFIFFRFREQWIAWYACAFLEAVINIISGQFVLLILKLGYFTNTTYGYIRWTKYIREHQEKKTNEKLTLKNIF